MSETANGHERWSEELSTYLLGGLSATEAAAFERHAEGCERCRAEARWLAPAVQALPEGVERLQPPPELRERLMAEVLADLADLRGEGAPEPEPTPGWRDRLAAAWRRLGSGPLGWRPLAGLAALALVVAAVAGYVVGNSGSEPSPVATVTSGQAPGIVAEMVREGEGGSLHLTNVKPLPEDKVLEAWVQREGTVEPVPALFAPDREGSARTDVDDMSGVETVMVTVEPAGGTKAPTSEPIVTMPIPG